MHTTTTYIPTFHAIPGTSERPALDQFIIRHCRAWCAQYAPSAEEPEVIAHRLLAFLGACDDYDREFWYARGWTPLFDHVEEITRLHAEGEDHAN